MPPIDRPACRIHPHELGRMYLYVHRPETVLATTVNGNIGRVQTIPTNVADTSTALRGMTLWVGTTAGAHDKGKIRLRANGAGVDLFVSEHEINLRNGDHLTVLDNYELWHLSPFVDVAGPTWYKDCDNAAAPGAVAFPGANQIYQPVPVMGPHSIQWIGEQHGFDWSNSWPIALGATIPVAVPNYTGTFPGAAVTYTTPRTGNAVWGVAGAEWATLVVTDSNAVAGEIGKRLYVTLDPNWTDAEARREGLYVDFRPTPRIGSVDEGGFSMQFTIYVDASEEDFPDEALVIWFFDGGTQETIGGNWPYRTHIHFIGHIVKGSTHKEPETGYVTFDVVTTQVLMKTLPVFPNFVEINAAPAEWTQASDLTVQRAAYLHMRWMSSLLEVADVIFDPVATTSIGEHEFPEGDLYSQLNALVNRDYLYRIGCDPLSTVYFNKDPQFLAAPPATIVTIQSQDWKGEIDFPEPLVPNTAYALASGYSYPLLTPLFSEAPGPVPLERGKRDKSLARLICTTQGALNTLSGLALAAANNGFPDVPVKMDGQYYIGHLFPMELVGLDISGLPLPMPGGSTRGTKRDVDLAGEEFVPRRSQLQIVYDQHGAPAHAQVGVNLEKLTTGEGVDGQDLTYPISVDDITVPGPDEGPEGGDWEPPAPPMPGPLPGDGNLLYLTDRATGKVFRTRNARHPTPASVVYEDLGVVDAGGLNYITLDSWDPKNVAMVCGPAGVWKTTNLDDAIPTWAQVSVVASGEAIMVASSILQQDLWMFSLIVPPGAYWKLWIRVSVNGGTTWPTAIEVTNAANPAAGRYTGQGKIEFSSHAAQTAWATYACSPHARVAKTANLWTGFARTNLGIGGNWGDVANPHHRYSFNPVDNIAFWAAAADTLICTTDPITGCTAGVITAARPWIGCATWTTDRYWVLTNSLGGRLYVSNDAITWTDRGNIGGTNQFVSGWPYGPSRFYACQDPDATPRGPIVITDDEGQNWQDQTGNWNVVYGSWGGDIRCCVPVWVV